MMLSNPVPVGVTTSTTGYGPSLEAATAIALSAVAGEPRGQFVSGLRGPELPVAATTTTPALTALLIDSFSGVSAVPPDVPRDRLTTVQRLCTERSSAAMMSPSAAPPPWSLKTCLLYTSPSPRD